MNIEVTQRIEFEGCYLYNRSLEAHRYKLEATVDSPERQTDFGMVINFNKLREYMKLSCPQATFLFCDDDPVSVQISKVLTGFGIPSQHMNSPITAETLCSMIATSLQNMLDLHEPGVRLLELKLRETPESFASWSRRKELQG